MSQRQDDGRRVRIHLTIPRELRERMGAVPGISWSRVAEAAFRRALELEARIARREAGKT
jgi:post-segregation antitoxin (ccd killing protein)